MAITTEIFGNVLVAHTPDELTEEVIGPFVAELTDIIDEGMHNVVLQMDRTEAYDSAGLEALLDISDHTRMARGVMKISGLEDPGRKIFEVTRLDQRLDIFDSVIDAVSSFQR